jgi:hypothetical protein
MSLARISQLLDTQNIIKPNLVSFKLQQLDVKAFFTACFKTRGLNELSMKNNGNFFNEITQIFKSDVDEIFDDLNPWKFGKDVSWFERIVF